MGAFLLFAASLLKHAKGKSLSSPAILCNRAQDLRMFLHGDRKDRNLKWLGSLVSDLLLQVASTMLLAPDYYAARANGKSSLSNQLVASIALTELFDLTEFVGRPFQDERSIALMEVERRQDSQDW
jgi:hypothetical protein